MCLPMRGGVFDAENRAHGFFICRAIKYGCPTYILNSKSSDNCKWLLQINELLIDIYHQANNVSDQVLTVDQVPELHPFLNDLRDLDSTLQPITRLVCTAPPLYIPPQSSVFLDINSWRAIPVPCRLWLMMHWMYDSFILPYMRPDGRYIVKFKYQTILEWTEGTQAAREALSKRA